MQLWKCDATLNYSCRGYSEKYVAELVLAMPLAHHRLHIGPFGLLLGGKRGWIYFSHHDGDKKRRKENVSDCEQRTDLLTLWDKGCQQQHINLLIV